MRRLILAATPIVVALVSNMAAAQAPTVVSLKKQTVGEATYFHVRIARPAETWTAPDFTAGHRTLPRWHPRADDVAHLPRLVPQDQKTRDVALCWRPSRDVPAQLEFAGRVVESGVARLRLIQFQGQPSGSPWPNAFVARPEVLIELDLGHAETMPPRAPRGPGNPPADPDPADLQSIWAHAQAMQFAIWNLQTPGFGFFRLAQNAIARQNGVKFEPLDDAATVGESRKEYERLYETTSGAAAVTESLQLARMLRTGRKEGPRKVAIGSIPGIDIAEHPWKQLMGDRQPDDEPLAGFVPHDNYFLTFKTVAGLVDLGDRADAWSVVISRFLEQQSADFRLRQRYERQLCLNSGTLAKALGPLVVRSLAVTGSDFYLREGSDVAVIFEAANPDALLAAVQPWLDAARREFGSRLTTARVDYHGTPIESFVSPRREISLHRAVIGPYVIYSNSPAGIRRVLDARAGRIPALASSRDFQYMRTVFRRSEPSEDGFAFLSDAFIRRFVGPASRIAEKRRLEGLAGVNLMTSAALWHAWQTGQPPADGAAALRLAGLEPSDLRTTDQSDVAWDAAASAAVSDRFNTIHFATPLIETPVEFATAEEASDYETFRLGYLNLWRQYFDPIGVRFRIADDRLRIDTYILPLIQSSQYAELRRLTGGGTVPRDISPPTPKTVLQLTGRLAADARERQMFEDMVGSMGANIKAGALGNWWIVRFDDSPMYAKLAKAQLRSDASSDVIDEWARTVFSMPVTLGVEVRNPLMMAAALAAVRGAVLNALPGGVTWEPIEPEYKGVKIVRIQATSQGARQFLGARDKEPFLPAVYYALVDGAWYASLQVQPIKDMIDRAAERPANPISESPQVNSAAYLSPAAAEATRSYVLGVAERAARSQDRANGLIWFAFYRGGLIDGGTPAATRRDVLHRWLGAVPATPDVAEFRLDSRTGLAVPEKTAASPLAKLLAEIADIRADLRFREDGVETTVEIRHRR
mgnify:CR=1 FL=1